MNLLNSHVRIVKCIIFLIPIGVALWLVVQYTAFFGTLHLEYDFEDDVQALSGFYPAGRALDASKNLRTKEASQNIVAEPVYFDVDVPRSFDGVDVTVEYKETQQPFVEFGVITNTDPWSTKLYPMKVRAIDEAARTWYRATADDGTILLQRNTQFETVDDFLSAVPTDVGIGTYRTRVPIAFRELSYTPNADGMSIDRVLRGSHEFVTYIQNETLSFSINVQDMNLASNEDRVTVQLLRDGEILHQEVLPDDGITQEARTTTDARTIALSVPNLSEGAYSIIVTTTDDVMITHIETAQHKFVVKNRLQLANSAQYAQQIPDIATDPTALYFQGALLSASTTHPESAQTIRVGNDNLFVHKPNMFFWWERKPEEPINTLRDVIVPENDVLLSTKGFFSFTADSFFDPNYLIQDIDETTLLDDVQYILYRDYLQPQNDARAFIQHIPISFDSVAGDRKHLTFLLSAPGMDRMHTSLQINHIRFDFHREPFYRRIINRFK